MKKIIVTGLIAATVTLGATGSAAALIPEDEAPGESPECVWGVLTAEGIAAGFSMGEHSSTQDNPRVGIANVVNQGDLEATCELLS
jgi:hypothetical protein